MKFLSGIDRYLAPSTRAEPAYPHTLRHKEVAKFGVVNDSLVEEYPGIYSFPLLAYDYCDYLCRIAEEEKYSSGCPIIFLDEISQSIQDQFLEVPGEAIGELIQALTTRSHISAFSDPYLVSVDGGSEEPRACTLEGDYTVAINVGGNGGGGLFFPKPFQSRFRAVEVPVGSAVMFPSCFESGLTQGSDSRITFLVVNFYIDQEYG